MKVEHSRELISIISLSQYLEKEANGHFYQLHKNFFLEFEKFANIKYLGMQNNLAIDHGFFYPAIPKRIARPMPFAKLNFIDRVIESCSLVKQGALIFIYDGNFFWALRASYFLYRNPSNRAIINLFNSKQTLHRFCSPLSGWLWREIFIWLQTVTNGRLIFSADNLKYLMEVKERVPGLAVELVPLPLPNYRKLTFPENKEKRFLVIIRGKKSAERLRALCRKLPQDLKFDIHGMSKKFVSALGLPDARVAESRISEEEYPSHLASFSKVVFMYDEDDFRFQSSGRLLDCMALSIPVYVPTHTALTSQFLPDSEAYVYSPENFLELYSVFTDSGDSIRGEILTNLTFPKAFRDLAHYRIHGSESFSEKKYQTALWGLIFGLIHGFETVVSAFSLEGRLNMNSVKDKGRNVGQKITRLLSHFSNFYK